MLEKNRIKAFVTMLMLIYMVSYLTRNNYSAVIVEMVNVTGYSRASLSLALTGSFITYGVGQLISGVCSDWFSPKRLILLGLIVTVAMNFLIMLCQNPTQMVIVWSINGFAQAFMWPPIVKMMNDYLSGDDYKRANYVVSIGGQIGTMTVYLISPILLLFGSWKMVFFVCGVCGGIMAGVWYLFSAGLPHVQPVAGEGETKETSHRSGMSGMLWLLGIMMLIVVLDGALRDGLTTWMPSYILDIYQMDSGSSILSSLVLPVFGIVCLRVTSYLYMNFIKNPVTCTMVLWGSCTVALYFLYQSVNGSFVVTLGLMALATGCLHGISLLLVGMVPEYFKNTGYVGTISGVLNACTYVGSAVSVYGIAVISEQAGWNQTVKIWSVIALVGTMLCGVCKYLWKTNIVKKVLVGK